MALKKAGSTSVFMAAHIGKDGENKNKFDGSSCAGYSIVHCLVENAGCASCYGATLRGEIRKANDIEGSFIDDTCLHCWF